jgi:hypothetical protein
LCFATALVEVLISWKFRHDTGNITDNPTPLYISLPWIIVGTVCLLYYLKLRFGSRVTTKYGDSAWEIEERKKLEAEAKVEKPSSAKAEGTSSKKKNKKD